MSFCTAVNCMDGRVQDPVNRYLRDRYGVAWVDAVTEAGPVGVLASDPDSAWAKEMYRKIDVSIRAHDSRGIGVVAHHDCAGNPKPRHEQLEELRTSVDVLRARYPDRTVVGLWVGEGWTVSEIDPERS